MKQNKKKVKNEYKKNKNNNPYFLFDEIKNDNKELFEIVQSNLGEFEYPLLIKISV